MENVTLKVVMAGLTALVLIIVAITIYFIPTIVASKNNHPYQLAISLINLFLGWSILGWVGALVWAVILPQNSINNNVSANSNKYDDLEKLQELKDKGTITQEEFEREKIKLLDE